MKVLLKYRLPTIPRYDTGLAASSIYIVLLKYRLPTLPRYDAGLAASSIYRVYTGSRLYYLNL